MTALIQGLKSNPSVFKRMKEAVRVTSLVIDPSVTGSD